MSQSLKKIKERFVKTLKKASKALEKVPSHVKRDEYVRHCVDNDIEGRLNKEELNLIGGFREAKLTYFDDVPLLTEEPKVLIYDIETAPILGYVWGLWDNNVGLNQIESDWYVLSWSAKWLGDPVEEVMYMDQRDAKNIENDKKILEGIWELLDEADIVITQNGKSFDQKKLNARFIIHDMKPPSSYRHIDTKRLAKKIFGFTSNSLAYMTDKLCTKYKKLKHVKFVGFSLWKECLAGNQEAWEEMEEYNRYDVLSLEELYLKMAPWDNSINFGVYVDGYENMCKCGSVDFEKSGFHHTNSARHQKWKCTECGSEMREATNLLTTYKRKKLKRGI